MKILVIILGNLIILGLGILLRFLYKKYFLKEEEITFSKVFDRKQSKSKEYDIDSFENEMSNRAFGCLFIIILVLLLCFFVS